MEKLIKDRENAKESVFVTIMVLFANVRTFADDIVPEGLRSLSESVIEAFTGDVAKIIIAICFAGSCIAYAFNKDNDKMKGKLVAVVVATGLLALSTVVVDKIFSGAGG